MTLNSLSWTLMASAFGLSCFAMAGSLAHGQPADVNYDESKVPDYQLPELLRTQEGQPVNTIEAWEQHRRPEILNLFAEHVYGRTPGGKADEVHFEVIESSDEALENQAIRKQVRIYLTDAPSPYADMLLYVPRTGTPAPVFVGLNFAGNHTIGDDPHIRLGRNWTREEDGQYEHRQASEDTRGRSSGRWQVTKLIERGYALATVHYQDLAPDHARIAFDHGVPQVFGTPDEAQRAADAWGTIGAWAWGLSRMLDYLEQEPLVNASQAAVIGHSRLGKTALWAGAQDPRFALVISNNSGCGGAALFRRCYGERVHHMARNFPHWFCRNYVQYAHKEDQMPVDQHMLVALIAPRPVYVASAVEDKWADPRGEFLAAKHAEPVYQLYGTSGLPADRWPEPDQPAQGAIGYHVRTGKHDVTEYDWSQYLDFADRHFGR